MATIVLYESDNSPGWHGSGGIYEVICEYAMEHPALQPYPAFVEGIRSSLWYRNLQLYEYSDAEIKAFMDAVSDLLSFVASFEGLERWGERQPIVYERVKLLLELLQGYIPRER